MKKQKYSVVYRGEFTADITARNAEEAIGKFVSGKVSIEALGELRDDYFEVFDVKGHEVYQEGSEKNDISGKDAL